GKPGKTISDQDLARHGRNGNITLSRPEPPRKEVPSPASVPRRSSVASFQNRLRSLDRQIRQTEDKIEFSRERLAKERWAPPGTGRLSRRRGGNFKSFPGELDFVDRKSTRLNSSHVASSYAVFCLKK